jgi:His-Xaa-Ser system radical SAM maturase HxsC
MIPLQLKVECDTALPPFVVRVAAGFPDQTGQGSRDAFVLGCEDETLSLASADVSFRLHGARTTEIDGDVLLIEPRRQLAHRLIRASSPHNTFLVTEQCDQLCVMCSQPPKPRHVDMYAHFREAALLAPAGATLGISGGEPTLHKTQLLEFLTEVLAERHDLQFHVLTNGQHFEATDLPVLRRLADRVLWGIPLYAVDPSLHDEIVGKEGAFQKLLRGLALLGRAGSQVELRTVIMRQNAESLPALADYVGRHLPFISVWAIMQMERIGFGRMNWEQCFYDNGERFSLVGAAIDILVARHQDVALYNFPLCTVPDAYRRFCMASISDWKRKYLDRCSSCRVRNECGGFFEWYADDIGYLEIMPQ